jgi:RNA polymerase sigma factor (sigma-70 family)
MADHLRENNCNLAQAPPNAHMEGPGVTEDQRLKALMVLSQSGDRAGYNRLLKEISVRIRPYIRSRIADMDAAEDVLQEVLLSVHRALASYDSARPLMPWLWAIVRYRIIDFARRTRRQLQGPGSSDIAFETLAAQPQADADGIRDLLKESIALLPEKQRLAFELTKLKGMSVREAAAVLKMTETATKVTVHRAKKSLQKIIKGLGYED